MSTYLIFASPQSTPPDDRSKVVADRFALLALVAPVIWLLVNRLWIEAVLALLLSVVAGLLLESGTWFWPGLTLALAISVITALEGRNWRAASLVRRGWQLVDLIDADNADTAFDFHCARMQGEAAHTGSAVAPSPQHAAKGPMTQRPARGHDSGSDAIGLVPIKRN